MTELTQSLIRDLQSVDTPTVCNALELLAPERRGYGFTTQALVCARPELPPMVGVARTATIRAAHPSHLTGQDARDMNDGYYAYVDDGPKPSITVIQDLDDAQRGYGAFWGEVNSAIHRGLGCLGVITDGSIRDIPDIAEGFQLLADRVVPSHAFVHVVNYGQPITVAGMRVTSGELINADKHGAVVIPWDVAHDVLRTAQQIAERERVLLSAATQPGFNIDKLREARGAAAEVKH